MGNFDRIFRLFSAAAIVILYTSNVIPGTFGLVMVGLAVILVLTAIIGICPLYAAIGLNTCPKKLRQ